MITKNIGLLLLAVMTSLNTLKAQGLKPANYVDGTQELQGMVTANAGKARAGVLILPAWKGIDEEAKAAALQLEKEGYVAFIADIYGKGNIPADNAAAARIAGSYKSDYKAYQHRVALALSQLKRFVKADQSNVAIIGYCFGGTGALEAARGQLPVKGVVCIHGGLSKAAERKNEPLDTKILVEHPADDTSVSNADYNNLIAELKEGRADWQVITYANSKHTFTNPESPDYNKEMANRAWAHTLMFLREVLR